MFGCSKFSEYLQEWETGEDGVSEEGLKGILVGGKRENSALMGRTKGCESSASTFRRREQGGEHGDARMERRGGALIGWRKENGVLMGGGLGRTGVKVKRISAAGERIKEAELV